ncbi:hypothetical protein [Flavobacterium sp. PS2]|uniref:hypothetical protein n=1 Tax=Flavobacterium sp. PS2 TaxID=3384157 RepID=UPI00390C6E99
MKKIFYIFLVSVLILSSCSKDDDYENDSTNILLRKEIGKENNKETYSSENVYNGNRIVSSGDISFTYTGNYITKQASAYYTYEFGYDNGKLVSYTEKFTGDNGFSKTAYTHNVDGTVSFKKYFVFNSTETEKATGTLTFKNGNLVKKEYVYKDNQEVVIQTAIKEYDTMNNPYKNILGCDLLFDDDRFLSMLNGNRNNIVKTTSTTSNIQEFFSDSLQKTISIFEYSYNSKGFPILRSSIDNNNKISTREYFY